MGRPSSKERKELTGVVLFALLTIIGIIAGEHFRIQAFVAAWVSLVVGTIGD